MCPLVVGHVLFVVAGSLLDGEGWVEEDVGFAFDLLLGVDDEVLEGDRSE